MKLYYSPTSPFARKVRIVAAELGIADRIELVAVATTPVKPDPGLASVNPLKKIPTLVLDDGTALPGSALVCDYLDSALGGNRLAPSSGPERWHAKRLEALADGLMEAAVLVRLEQALRPEALRWDDWISGQGGKVADTLSLLDDEAGTLSLEPGLGQIGIGAALGYMDFRFGNMGWRDAHPALARWYADFAERPSMRESRPE